MQRTPSLGNTCFVGLTAFVLYFSACGMNEGGRCQIDSDCASGLTCKEASTGNGTCQGSTITFAGPEAGPEAAASTSTIDTSEPNTSVLDASVLDAGGLDANDIDVGMLDDGAVDSGELDSTELD